MIFTDVLRSFLAQDLLLIKGSGGDQMGWISMSKIKTGVVGLIVIFMGPQAIHAEDGPKSTEEIKSEERALCLKEFKTYNSSVGSCKKSGQACLDYQANFAKCNDMLSDEADNWPPNNRNYSRFASKVVKECPQLAARQYDSANEDYKDIQERVDSLFDESQETKQKLIEAQGDIETEVNDLLTQKYETDQEMVESLSDLELELNDIDYDMKNEIHDLNERVQKLRTERENLQNSVKEAKSAYQKAIRDILLRCDQQAREAANQLINQIESDSRNGNLNLGTFGQGVSFSSKRRIKRKKNRAKLVYKACKSSRMTKVAMQDALDAYNNTKQRLITQDRNLLADIERALKQIESKYSHSKNKARSMAGKVAGRARQLALRSQTLQRQALQRQQQGQQLLQSMQNGVQQMDVRRKQYETREAALAMQVRGFKPAAGLQDYFEEDKKGFSFDDVVASRDTAAAACCSNNAEYGSNVSAICSGNWETTVRDSIKSRGTKD